MRAGCRWIVSSKTLNISWLNGRFRAVVMQGREPGIAWTAPAPVTELTALGQVIGEAVLATGFRSRDVVMVVDNRNVIYHLQETPPGKSGTVRRLIERQVQQQPFFQEPPVWGLRELPPAKGRNRYLLTVVPQSVLVAVREACEKSKLLLKGLFVPADVFQRRLVDATLDPVRPVMLAAAADDLLCLLAGDSSGRILFARSFPISNPIDVERVVQEISRTQLFARQQFGVSINECRLSGAVLGAETLRTHVRNEMRFVDGMQPADEFELAREVARLPIGSEVNLARKTNAATISNRRLAIAASVLLAASIGFGALVELELRVDAREAIRLQQSATAAEASELKNLSRQHEADQLSNQVQMLDPSNFPPLSPAVLRELGAITPGDLTLSAVTVGQTNGIWTLRIEGRTTESIAGAVPLLRQFEANLTNRPLGLQISDSSRQRVFGTWDGGQPALPLEPSGQRTFFIEGRLR